MLASPESVLAPGHRLPMKGSIMNPFLLPLPGPPARRGCGPPRARPRPGRGEAALGQLRQLRQPRRRRRELRAVPGETAQRSRRRRPCQPPLPFPLCVPGPGAGGAPRSPAAASELGPAAPPPPPAPQIPPFLDSEARVCY